MAIDVYSSLSVKDGPKGIEEGGPTSAALSSQARFPGPQFDGEVDHR